jgi:hypothetical protein
MINYSILLVVFILTIIPYLLLGCYYDPNKNNNNHNNNDNNSQSTSTSTSTYYNQLSPSLIIFFICCSILTMVMGMVTFLLLTVPIYDAIRQIQMISCLHSMIRMTDVRLSLSL